MGDLWAVRLADGSWWTLFGMMALYPSREAALHYLTERQRVDVRPDHQYLRAKVVCVELREVPHG